MTHAIEGVHCAAATPITADGGPAYELFGRHCRTLLDEGCHSVALLGTTGEANSFGLDDRLTLLDAAVEAGIPSGRLLPGTSSPALADAVALTAHAVRAGVKGCLLLPPYYYKGVSDEGLFRFYAKVIEGVGDDRLRVVLYHIPQISGIAISHDLIDRLITAFPGIVVGIKDSSGELANMEAMCARFANLSVLAGADPLMLPLLPMGGAGCITAAANLCADSLRIVWDGWRDPDQKDRVAAAQAKIAAWRGLTGRYAPIATVKTMIARKRGDRAWLRMMPPLVELSSDQQEDVWAKMEQLNTNDQTG